MYLDVKSLYRLARPQKLPLSSFKWAGKTSQSNEDFISNYN